MYEDLPHQWAVYRENKTLFKIFKSKTAAHTRMTEEFGLSYHWFRHNNPNQKIVPPYRFEDHDRFRSKSLEERVKEAVDHGWHVVEFKLVPVGENK